jgi:hypothetical protein
MKKLRFFVVAGLFIFTAFCGGLLLSSWTSQANATSQATNNASPTNVEASAPNDNDDITVEFGALPEAAFDEMSPDTMQFFFQGNAENGMANMMAGPGGMAMRVGPNGDGPELQGVITKIENNGAKVTVNQRVVNVNDQTVVGDANGTLKKEDLKVGDRVVALGKAESDKSLTARWVLRQPALPIFLNGAVSSVDTASNSLKFKVGKDNTEWTATVSANTKITRSGTAISLGDLKPGDNINVSGIADRTAKKIEANTISTGRPAAMPRPSKDNFSAGTVKSIDAANNAFVISETVGITPTERKIVVDSSTRFVGPNGVKALSDLKVGDKVVATGDKQTDGSLKARNVAVGADFRGGPGDRKGQPGGNMRPGGPGRPGNPGDPQHPKDKNG